MIKELFEPLIAGIKMLRKKPITWNFPPKMPISERFRGRHLLNIERCIGCGTCARACPNDAIEMVESSGKKLPSIDYAKCAFCGLCVDVCPTKALTETNFPIILAMDRKTLKFSPEMLAEQPKPPQHGVVKPKGTKEWGMARSLWVLNYFTGCCYIEAVPWASSAFDMERFGMLLKSSPRHADVLIVGGYVTRKSAKRIARIYAQMSFPKFVIALGNCPMTGGTYWDSYNTIKDIEKYIPVDIWIAGCPPRPESIGVAAVEAMQAIMQGYKGRKEEVAHVEVPVEEVPIKDEKGKKEVIIEEFVLPYGPQHPSSGNFHAELEVEGERIIRAIPSPGYLHRGFEKLYEYRTWLQNIVLTPRTCVLDGGNYEMPYVEAIEAIAGIKVPRRARYIRTIIMELSRIQSHLMALGILGMAAGLDSMARICWGDRDRILFLKERISGGRVYDIIATPGGVRRDLPDNFATEMKKTFQFLRERLKIYDEMMFENDIFIQRTRKVGVLNKETAEKLGVTGPVARASGINLDLRRDNPYEAYGDLEFEVPVFTEGDAYHRALVRRIELEQSMRIIEEAVEKIPGGKIRETKMKNGRKFNPFAPIPEGEAIALIECARGEFGYHIVSTGGKSPYRVKIIGPTVENILVTLPELLKGAYVADAPVIYWSLDTCPADHDR